MDVPTAILRFLVGRIRLDDRKTLSEKLASARP